MRWREFYFVEYSWTALTEVIALIESKISCFIENFILKSTNIILCTLKAELIQSTVDGVLLNIISGK